MEREVNFVPVEIAPDVAEHDPFAQAWGDLDPAENTDSVATVEIESDSDSDVPLEKNVVQIQRIKAVQKEYMTLVGVMAPLLQGGGLLNFAHAVGACACHGGALLASAGNVGGGINALGGLSGFHTHADGTVHYGNHDEENHHQHNPTQATSSGGSFCGTTKLTPPKAPFKLFDIDSRGLSYLFEPQFTSVGIAQGLLAA